MQTYSQLQVASAMVGYLESQLKDTKEQLEFVSEAESHLNELDRVNAQLETLARQAKIAEELETKNRAMRQLIVQTRTKSTWWQTLRSLLVFGNAEAQDGKELEMADYYSMIQEHLDGQ